MHKSKYYTERDIGKPLARDPHFCGCVEPEKRQVRDVCFAILFVICLLGLAVLTAAAAANADLSLINVHSKYTMASDMGGLKENQNVIIVSVLITLALGLVWLELLKRCTWFMVWMSFLGAIAAMAAGGVGLIAMASDNVKGTKIFLQITGGAICVLAVVLLVVLIVKRNLVNFSCRVLQQASKALIANPAIFFITTPLFVLLSFAYVSWNIAALLYVFAAQGAERDCTVEDTRFDCLTRGCDWYYNSTVGAEDYECGGDGYDLETATRWAVLYIIFMFFWGIFFLAGAMRTSIAGPVATWYFSREKSAFVNMEHVLRHLGLAFSYSFGSIALGSLLVAVVRMVSWCANVAEKEAENACARFCIRMFRCCWGCLETFVRFVTNYGFVYVAMHGGSFYTSCREVQNLFDRCSWGKILMSHVLARFIAQMGMVFAAGTVCFGASLYMNNHTELSGTAVTVNIIVCLFAFWLMGLIVEVAADTIVVSFMEDQERHAESRDFRGEDMYFSIQDGCK
eukprot:gene14-22_t